MGSKKTAAQVNTEQSDVPEQFRSNIRVSEDGQSVTHTYTTPRYEVVQVRGDYTVTLDNARLAGQSRQFEIHKRGVKKQICDGAKTRVQYRDKDTGKIVWHTLTEAERQVDAVAHADLMLAWMYGEREKASRRDAVDVVTHECRAAVVAFVCQNMSDEDGEKYTKSSVPSSLARACSVADVQNAAKQIGVPPKYLKGLISTGKAIAELRSDTAGMEVDPADLI